MSLQCLYLCTSQDWIFFGKILNLSLFHLVLLFCYFSLEHGRPSGSIGRWLGTCENMMVSKKIHIRQANRGGSIARPSVLLWDLLPSRFEKVAFLCP